MSAASRTAAVAAAAPGKIERAGWWSVAVVAIFNIVSLIDRNAVAVLIPEMRADLGLTDFQISLVQGLAFALFYGAMGLIIGGLVDTYPRRLIMFAGICIWSAAAAATGLARNYAQLFAARLFVGFGEGAISPAAQSLLAATFPRQRLSTPMAIFTASGTVGISLSMLLAGLLLDRFSHHPFALLAGLAPWRQVLIVTGLPGLLVAFLALTLHEPDRGRLRATPSAEDASWRAFFAFLARERRMMGGLLGGFCLSAMGTQGMMTWAPTYARRVLGVSASHAGGGTGLAIAGGGIAGGIMLGLLIDRSIAAGHRDIAIRLFAVLSATILPLAAATFLIGDIRLMFAAILVVQLTVGASFGPGLAAIQMIAPPQMRGRCAALAVLVGSLGGFALGPMLIGAFTDFLFRDPQAVGHAIATALLILGPGAGALLLWARPAFARRLCEDTR